MDQKTKISQEEIKQWIDHLIEIEADLNSLWRILDYRSELWPRITSHKSMMNPDPMRELKYEVMWNTVKELKEECVERQSELHASIETKEEIVF
jgi:hypothetical protein